MADSTSRRKFVHKTHGTARKTDSGKIQYPYDLTGCKFGRLVVLRFSHRHPSTRHSSWVVQCACGVVKATTRNSLVMGHSTSCGCYNKEKLKSQVPHNRTPDAVAAAIAADYAAKVPTPHIAAKHGVSVTKITSTVRRIGGRVRSLSESKRYLPLDQSVFQNPTSEGKYWIGMLMADGCVHKNSVNLTLAAKDVAHVERFRSFLKSGSKITHHGKTNSDGISVRSETLVESLSRFGVVPRKSLIAKVIGLEMDRDFWRGAVDGDGTVRIEDRDRPLIVFNGSKFLVEQFMAFVSTICPTKASIIKVPSIYSFRVCGSYAIDIVTALYKDAKVVLERKMKIAEQIMASKWGRIYGKRRHLRDIS